MSTLSELGTLRPTMEIGNQEVYDLLQSKRDIVDLTTQTCLALTLIPILLPTLRCMRKKTQASKASFWGGIGAYLVCSKMTHSLVEMYYLGRFLDESTWDDNVIRRVASAQAIHIEKSRSYCFN